MASAVAYAPMSVSDYSAGRSPSASPPADSATAHSALTLNGSASHSGYASVTRSSTAQWEYGVHATPVDAGHLAAAAAAAAVGGAAAVTRESLHGANPTLGDQQTHRLVHPSMHGVSDGDTTADIVGVGDEAEVEEKSSINSSVFVLAATTLGAGILALPYAMSLLGWLFGSVLLVSVGACSSYSILLLLETGRAVGATTYEELGHAIFPRFGKRLVVACTLLLIFGSLTAFFVIISDTITPAIQNMVGNSSSFFTNQHVLLVTVAVVVVYPLCLLKSIHALERWSFLAVGIILLFSLLVIVESVRAMVNGTAAPDADGLDPSISRHVHAASAGTNMFAALPIICLAFTCHSMLFPIWNSLAGGSDTHSASGSSVSVGPEASSTGLAPVSSMWSVVNRSLLLCGLLYLPVGVFGFILFGQQTHGDVLNNFGKHVFFDVVRLLFTLAICIHYPVVHFGFRTAILRTWFDDYTEQENRWRFHVITVGAVTASLLLAIALPNLSTVFSLTGAMCAFPYCFMAPTAFYLRLHQVGAPIMYLRGPLAGRGAGAAQGGEECGADQSVYDDGDDRVAAEGGYSPLANGAPTGQKQQRNGYASVAAVLPVSADDQGAADGVTSAPPSRCSSLFPASNLPRRSLIPAYAVLIVATIIWIISIVICFKDMIGTLTKEGVK